MDLITVREIRVPRTREELAFAPGTLPLGGGTWLFSEEQEGLTGLVDLTGLGWEPLTVTDDTLSIAATCTVAQLSRLEARAGWAAHPLIGQCCNSFLASFKIWNVATVGGNIAIALPAGPMISLAVTLDATATLWAPGGRDRRIPVAELITGVRQTMLEPGEVLRSIEIPLAALKSRTGFRRIALSPLGRTGTLVTARLGAASGDTAGEFTVTVTGGTPAPRQFRFEGVPAASALAEAVDSIDDWHDDAHGTPDWRRAMSLRFAEQLRQELDA